MVDIAASLIVNNAAYGIVENGMKRSIAPKQGAQPVCRISFSDFCGVYRLVGVTFQIIFVQPTLNHSSTLIGKDEPNGNINHFMQAATKEITNRTAIISSVGIHYFPMTDCIVLRCCTHHSRYLHITHSTYAPGISNGVLITFYGALIETLQGHFHVALPGTDPHFSGKNAMQGYSFSITEGDAEWRVTSFRSTDAKAPPPLLVSHSRMTWSPGWFDDNACFWGSPSP